MREKLNMTEASWLYLKKRYSKLFSNPASLGKVVYYVYALGKSSYIQPYRLTSLPYVVSWNGSQDNKNIFVDAGYLDYAQPINFSLEDCNVIPNSYNQHKLFFSQSWAKKYLAKCVRENIDLPAPKVHKYSC